MNRFSATGICKSFSSPVLRGVDLQIAPGSILGLIGENGAGKSTLARIMLGLQSADSGAMSIDDQPYQPQNASESLAAGVAICAQELSLIDELSIADNIHLASSPSGLSRIDRTTADQSAESLLREVGMEKANPSQLAKTLSLADKQLVEIAKSLANNPKLWILDEPTSALTGPQADQLHELLRRKAKNGTSVIYVSHRLGDILDVCDHVTVLRDGVVTMSRDNEGLSEDLLIREMAGEGIAFDGSRTASAGTEDVVLKVDALQSSDLRHPISFDARRGEIIGIAGLAGSGRTELLRAIFALDRRTGGRVSVRSGNGWQEIRNPRQAIRYGMGFVPEDRAADGIFKSLSNAFNVTSAGLWRIAGGFGRLSRSREESAVNAQIANLGVKCESASQTIGELSGGNQQKLIIARWLFSESGLLLLDEPTRGVDVGAKFAIHEELVELRDSGISVVVASSELDELLSLCDRILVLSEQKLVAEFQRGEAEWGQEKILAAAFSEHLSRGQTNEIAKTATN